MNKVLLNGGILVILASVLGCSPGTPSTPKQATVTIKGSDTMVHLMSTWAESYMKVHPGVEVTVTGGGSGTGIAALLNKTTDICAASRSMSAEEKAKAGQTGISLKETTVARDAIALVVHPSNPLNEISLEQLKKIYTGAYTNWAEIGGTPGEFIVLSRESSSGTYVFFQEHVLKKEDYTPKARLMPATSAIIQAASQDVLSIGYVGLGYAKEGAGRVKVLKVKADANAPAIEPSEATVRDASYSIARPLFFYADAALSKPANDFIQFCLSDAGQAIVREAGFVPEK